MNTTTVKEKFTDQFFASTQGRNDVRREMIEEYLQAHTDRVVEAIGKTKQEHTSTDMDSKYYYEKVGFNQGIDTSIQIVKTTK